MKIKTRKMFAGNKDLTCENKALILHRTKEWGNEFPVAVVPIKSQKLIAEVIAEAIHGYKAAPSTNKEFYLKSSRNVMRALGILIEPKK